MTPKQTGHTPGPMTHEQYYRLTSIMNMSPDTLPEKLLDKVIILSELSKNYRKQNYELVEALQDVLSGYQQKDGQWVHSFGPKVAKQFQDSLNKAKQALSKAGAL